MSEKIPHTQMSAAAGLPADTAVSPKFKGSSPKISLSFDFKRGLPFLVGLIVFVLYAFNVSTTVTYGSDCGEFAATVWNLGIGHPTGFALYCSLARTFTSLVPWGEVAWRLNILSALCGAVTVGMTCATLLRVLDSRHTPHSSPTFQNQTSQNDSTPDDAIVAWSSIGASLLLAGFFFLFAQAVIIDVHVMIAAMTALLIYCAVRWHQSVQENDPDWRWLYSLAVLAGLALNTHMSWIFAFPGLFYLAMGHHRGVFGTRRQWWRRLGGLLAFTGAAYALTLYFPLRASLFPAPVNGQWWPLDWTNITSFGSWYAHIRAHQYEFLFLQPTPVEFAGHHFVMKWFASPPSAIPGKTGALLIQLLAQWLWAFLLIPAGAVACWKRDRALGIALALIVLCNLGFEINYNVPTSEMANFLFPFYLVLAIWMGFGLQAALLKVAQVGARWDDRISSTRNAQNPSASGWQWRLGTLAKLLIPATIFAQWSLSIPMATRHGDLHARDAAIERATALERLQSQFPTQKVTAVITGSDDSLWSFWYAQFVLNRARGVQTPWGLPLRRRIGRQSFTALTHEWQARGPVAYTYFYPEIDANFPLTPLLPNGLIWLASRRTLPLPATPISDIEYSKVASKTILNALFPVAMMRRNEGENEGEHAKSSVEMAHLKRENMTTLTLDFRAPFTTPLSPGETGAPTTDLKSVPVAVQTGFIEVLVSPQDFFTPSPLPSQGEVAEKDWHVPSPLAIDARGASLTVTKQTLRLVVPQGTRVGATLRVQLPLQIAVGALGEHIVWVRLVRHANNTTTAWQRVAVIQVTAA